MARLYPERLPDTVESQAERRLFDVFQKEFSDDFVVFSQVRWLAKRRGRGAEDGEADFVVAHPRHGVLVLEVKGGGIKYDGPAGRWTSVDRRGREHPIEDPLSQARRSMYNLLSKLRESELTAPYKYHMTYAVAFPDVRFEQEIGPQAPKEIVLDLLKVRDLKQSVIDVFRFRNRPGDSGPGETAIHALVELLGRSWHVEACIGAALDEQEIQIRELTERQFRLLDFLGGRRRALVCGCAGSGKTMLAIEKASRLAASGFRVLFTCFNANLSNWAARQLSRCGAEVKHFHRLCFDLAKEAGMELEQRPGESQGQFFDRFPDALLEACRRLPTRFDAIIVDEGQDFREEWWVALLTLLEDPDQGILYIFYDNNQRIYGKGSAYPLDNEPYVLTENCRNTKQIHEAVMTFYASEDRPVCLGPSGLAPKLLGLGPGADERQAVESLIDELVTKEGVRPGDVAILTPRSRARSAWRPGPRRHWNLTWDLDHSAGKVLCSTIHAFKGLERPAIILSEIGDLPPYSRTELMYVALSRAREYLVVAGSIAPPDALPTV